MTHKNETDECMAESIGALVCGVCRKGDGEYLVAEKLSGETIMFVLSGNRERTFEEIVSRLYIKSIVEASICLSRLEVMESRRALARGRMNADLVEVEEMTENIKLATWIREANPAYHTILWRRENQYRRAKFIGVLQRLRPERIRKPHKRYGYSHEGYPKICGHAGSGMGRTISFKENDEKIPHTIRILSARKDSRSIPQIIRDALGIMAPPLDPWWQEKFGVAQEYFRLLEKMSRVESRLALENLQGRLDKLLEPFAGSALPAHSRFCEVLLQKREIVQLRRRGLLMEDMENEKED